MRQDHSRSCRTHAFRHDRLRAFGEVVSDSVVITALAPESPVGWEN